ncbi:MAG: GH116 family glycosyl hydrolase [Bacteroidetes bacterium]|nr:GH116 family glycosyl hydrolase [Bacteroidota bacterium]
MQSCRIKILLFVLFLITFWAADASAQATKGTTFRTHNYYLSSVKKTVKLPDSIGMVAFLGDVPEAEMDKESRAAFDFLKSLKGYYPVYLTFREIKKNPKLLDSFKLAWFHRQDTARFSSTESDKKVINGILGFLDKGGDLLLTLNAFRYINTLGIEPVLPTDSIKTSRDDGYGRKLGLHSFLDHPVFDGMFGGSYVMMPFKDTAFRITGFFGSSVPGKGKVTGVDWDYIFLREESKLMLEYNAGKGKVIAIGGYTCYSVPNMNRIHLELFTANIFRYFRSAASHTEIRCWDYTPASVYSLPGKVQDTDPLFAAIPASEKWEIPDDPLALSDRYSSGNFWDVAGERLLTMGNENGGIEEIWAHPFMAFRDYEVGLRFEYKDSIYWLKDERPETEVLPWCFKRTYKFPRAYLQEIISNDPYEPDGVIHYEYQGVYPAELVVKVKSNLRLMWPYSEKVLGSMGHAYDQDYHGFLIQDQSGTFVSMIGANRKPDVYSIGQFSDFEYKKGSKTFEGIPSGELRVTGLLTYSLAMVDRMDVVYAATSEGVKKTSLYFEASLRSPRMIVERAKSHTDSLLANNLMITSPDAEFNRGYRWALLATDRFFVNTPGMGKSLVAGYSTTSTGWDGGHKVNGRPGYGWYFGRDGEWSGFALLDYGAFEKVRSVLEFYCRYQDISGKILHEATTSGVVHYDAADATPLFIVLAGRYFRHAQDTAFLRSIWPSVRKAVDFCFSTDTDHDHLIENTNVGHGWVEGGELYGSHATLYMQGCWAAALLETANMAAAMKSPEAESYTLEAGIVKSLINTRFWKPSLRYYSYGMDKNLTYRSEPTVLPAVPLLFKMADPEKAKPVLEQLASNAFSTNWGTRILREDSPFFKPTGYHYGSVWPLFTGWTALAEYAYGNYPQGFSHIMNNLNIYKNWGKGFVEEVMNGASYQPSGVCPHQCWSETMVLQPAIEGLLGFKIDGSENKVILTPHFPASWDSVNVRNLRIGNSVFDFCMKRMKGSCFFTFTPQGTLPIKVEFTPAFPAGTRFIHVLKDGKETPFATFNDQKNTYVLTTLILSESSSLRMEYDKGIEVLPAVADPHPGSRPEGLRIISTQYSGYTYYIGVEGESNTSGNVDLYIHNQNIEKIENGTIQGWDGEICHLVVDFGSSLAKYQNKTIIIHLRQS